MARKFGECCNKRTLLLIGVGVLVCFLSLVLVQAMFFPKHDLYVLMYHHVVEDGGECNDMTVTVSRLKKDLYWIKAHGYQTVLPRELAAGEPLPERAVMITFDDGYRSNYELLYPALQEEGMKAVISVITCMPDHGDQHYIDWEMCREMTESGLVEIGSHTYALHNLDAKGLVTSGGVNGIQRAPNESYESFQARVLDDIQKSYDLIAENVGQTPTFFAYPFGVTERSALALINSLFPVTALTQSGIAQVGSDFHGLPRFRVTMATGMDSFLPP